LKLERLVSLFSFSFFYVFVKLTEFDKIYQRLDVTLIERGESFYQEMMPKVVADLERKGMSLNAAKPSRFLSQL